ncbi:hypothetical protein OG905_37425 [Streptomyces sp. NBC_00322]|uniref:hypothetical protein n=1 Tax=Streptomyces sp. NBC_00322 TaxID=2975712 RepID=UPI002E2BF5DE|nr:hypothetical protein [Streptomyces sp. NBC_00322]
MLGDLLGEEQGETTGMRVLPSDNGQPAMEASFQAVGTLLNAAVRDMGTYESFVRPDGTLFGDGQGIIMTHEGETVTWHGQGVGHFTDAGGVKWRGAIYYETAAAKFADLAGGVGVFEFDTTEDGKVTAKVFEWK